MSNALDVGAIKGSIKLDDTDFVGGIKRSMKSMVDFKAMTTSWTADLRNTSAQLKSIGTTAREIGREVSFAGAAIGAGLGLASRSFIEAASTAEQFQVRLKVLLRSTEEGNRLFSEMTKFASSVAFEYQDIMAAATNLTAVVKGGVDEVRAWMPLIADVAAASGLGIRETTDQVTRMLSAGAASADLFAERGVLAMLGFERGVSYSVQETRKALVEAWRDPLSSFRGAAKELSDTWSGQLSMLADKWFLFRKAVMDAGLFADLKAGLSTLNNALAANQDRITDWVKLHGDLISKITLGTAAFAASATAMGSFGLAAKGAAFVTGTLLKTLQTFAALRTVDVLKSIALGFVGMGTAAEGAWMKAISGSVKFTAAIGAAVAGVYLIRSALREIGAVDLSRLVPDVKVPEFMKNYVQQLKDGAETLRDLFKGKGFLGEDIGKSQIQEDLTNVATGALDLAKQDVAKIQELLTNLVPTGLDVGAQLSDAMTGDLERFFSEGGGLDKAAKKAVDRLKEEAANLRLSLYPEEALMVDVARIGEMAAKFPSIVDPETVRRASAKIFEDFKGRGLDAVAAIDKGLLSIPKQFEKAMREAALSAKVMATEAFMDLGANKEDSDYLASVGRGTALSDRLTGEGLVKQLATDMEDLKNAGRLDGEQMNLLATEYWDQLSNYSQGAASQILLTMQGLGPQAAQAFKDVQKAAALDAIPEKLNKLTGAAREAARGLADLGAKGIAKAVAGVADFAANLVGMATTIKSFKGLWAAFTAEGISAAVKVGAALDIATAGVTLLAQALAAATSFFGIFGKEGEKELKGMAKVIDEIRDASEQWIDSLADHFVEFVRTGQTSWREFVDQILDDILRISTAELLIRPAVNWFGDRLFKDGGAFDKGHIVESPEWFATKQGPALRGEAGTEVVMPAVRLADGTLGVKSSGAGAPMVNVQIIDQREAGAPQPIVNARKGVDGSELIEIVLQAVHREMSLGRYDNAMRGAQYRM